jgi:16S rRNA processing protein RimM
MSGPGNRRVLMGVVVAPHGVRGEVRIQSHCEDPADIGSYGALTDESGKRSYTVHPLGEVRGNVLARIDGVADRNAADRLRGLRLYVAREALPPAADGEWYHVDLIGLRAVGVDGKEYGKVLAVEDFGAGTLLEVGEGTGGRSFMLPFSDQAVPTVDIAGGVVTIDPPAGLLEPVRKGER